MASLRDKLNSNQLQSFVYDELNRLTQTYTDSVGQAQYNRSYQYNTIGNLINKAGTSQWYGGQSSSCPDGYLYKPHAVVTAGSDTFCYDRNGNMVKRNGTTYTLTYDAENRLVGVSGAASASFTYDGDGKLVKRVAGQTTVYVTDRYQKNTSTGQVTKYYYFGSRRLAVRMAGTPMRIPKLGAGFHARVGVAVGVGATVAVVLGVGMFPVGAAVGVLVAVAMGEERAEAWPRTAAKAVTTRIRIVNLDCLDINCYL